MEDKKPKSVWTDQFSFITGAIRRKDLGYFAISGDEMTERKISHAFILERNKEKWNKAGDHLNWSVVSIAITKHPLEQMIALGPRGQIFCMGSGDHGHEEKIKDGERDPDKVGLLRSICAIDGKAYAAGVDRQVYKREDAHKWICIDESMRPKGDFKDRPFVCFEAINGFSEKDIYATGWTGAVWHYDGKTWTEIPPLTKHVLTSITCASDGTVYITGRRGTILKGNKDGLELIHGDDKNFNSINPKSYNDDIWGSAWFDNKLYVSGLKGVYTLEKDTLVPVDFGKDKPKTYYSLSAADGIVWSIGAKDVMEFDGKKWKRID